jgi:SpoVK/Ycf46/Vps4 family AAA+-type ATPase
LVDYSILAHGRYLLADTLRWTATAASARPQRVIQPHVASYTQGARHRHVVVGVLLYGPPGCSKTLIAKAVANSLAKQVAAKTAADEGAKEGKSFFLNIKGPELLNKYVGETERHIRLVFQRAREKASEGMTVIVFFDEMDSIFRTRGSGVSSDVENTIVPQLLAEIDGVEGLENVIVIGDFPVCPSPSFAGDT